MASWHLLYTAYHYAGPVSWPQRTRRSDTRFDTEIRAATTGADEASAPTRMREFDPNPVRLALRPGDDCSAISEVVATGSRAA